VSVRFIGGGNQSTRRKPPTCRKSLANYDIMLYRVHLAWVGFELCVVLCTECVGSNKSNYHAITTMVGGFHVKYCLPFLESGKGKGVGDRYFSINIEYHVLV
jgi:hypothetical protein